jgi:hypothetical protein
MELATTPLMTASDQFVLNGGLFQMISLWVYGAWFVRDRCTNTSILLSPLTSVGCRQLFLLCSAIYLVTGRQCDWRINVPQTVTLMWMFALSLLNDLSFHWQILMVLQWVLGLTAIIFLSKVICDSNESDNGGAERRLRLLSRFFLLLVLSGFFKWNLEWQPLFFKSGS